MNCHIVPPRRLQFCCAILFSILMAQCALATSVVPPSFDDLVRRADFIFTGRAISQQSEWRQKGGEKSIITLVSFQVNAVHKGSAGSVVTLQFLGGTVGNATLDVSEMPKFKTGERVVLFVEKNGVNASPLIGFCHGKFSIRPGAPGRETVLTHDGRPLTDTATLGRAKAASQVSAGPLSLEAFTSKVRERVAAISKYPSSK